MNSKNSIKNLLILQKIPNVGPINAKKIIAYCGGVDNVFLKSKKELLTIPGVSNKIVDEIINHQHYQHDIEDEIDFIEKNNLYVYTYLDKGYPDKLKLNEDSPLILFTKNKLNVNNYKIVSIVGTRNASEYGKANCENLIKDLAEYKDIIILSGLAYGIDICAHRAALKYNIPTIAVVAHGLNQIYPKSHYDTAKQMIVQHGNIITEFTSKSNPERENFPKRNRIVAGMSDIIIVIESGVKGGSMITAKLGNDYHKDVFAYPGNINHEFAKGCHQLIKTNRAHLIESANDIIEIMSWQKENDSNNQNNSIQTSLFIELNEEEEKITDCLKNEKLHIDVISNLTGLTQSTLAANLLNLEFQGIVSSLPGKVYKLN